MSAEPNCQRETADPDAWFAFTHSTAETVVQTKAQSLCAECPAAQECLQAALNLEGGKSAYYRSGIWGGTTPRQRYAIARTRKKANG